LASRINDLHIWFRTQQDLDIESKKHSGKSKAEDPRNE
jgi:hypothetical protein